MNVNHSVASAAQESGGSWQVGRCCGGSGDGPRPDGLTFFCFTSVCCSFALRKSIKSG